jgi:hypothetical protein
VKNTIQKVRIQPLERWRTEDRHQLMMQMQMKGRDIS